MTQPPEAGKQQAVTRMEKGLWGELGCGRGCGGQEGGETERGRDERVAESKLGVRFKETCQADGEGLAGA